MKILLILGEFLYHLLPLTPPGGTLILMVLFTKTLGKVPIQQLTIFQREEDSWHLNPFRIFGMSVPPGIFSEIQR
jgi:hypothetical protein